MSTHPRWIAALLALSALTACATTAPSGTRSAPAAAAPPTQQTYVTGSRIALPEAGVTGSRSALPADPHAGAPDAASPTQIVTEEDLRLSGQTDLAAALRRLVPALH